MLLKNATITRKDGSSGKLLPIAVPHDRRLQGARARLLREQPELLPRRLLEHAERGRAGQRGRRRTRASSPRSRRSTRRPRSTYMRGFTGTGTNAGNCCSDDRSGRGDGRGRLRLRDRRTPAWTRAHRRGRPGPRIATARRLTLPGQQGQLISQVAAANPNTVAVMETIGPQDVTGVRAEHPRDPVELVQRACARASRWPTCCSATTTRAAARREIVVPDRSTRSRAIYELRDPPGRAQRPHLHVLHRPGLLPVRLRPELHARSTSRTCRSPSAHPTADDTINVSVDVTNTQLA